MKKLIPIIILSLVLSSCQSAPIPEVTSTSTPTQQVQSEFPSGFLRSSGQVLVNADSAVPLRLRAVNFTHDPLVQDYSDARSMGFNAVRLGLDMDLFSTTETANSWLDTQVASAKEAGIYLIFSLNTKSDQSNLWSDTAEQQAVLDFWDSIARSYAAEVVIAAYDLLNRPVPMGLDQWQSLAEKIANTIRASDSNHPLIVQAALVPDRTFIYLEDPNYILGFDFFKPYEFTVKNQGQYPSETIFLPPWEDFRLSENVSNPKLAAGTTDWTETGASLNLVVNRETVIGVPAVACDYLLGSAWFSNFTVREYDETGEYLRDVNTIDLAQTNFWGTWSPNNNTLIEKVDDSPWGPAGKSINFAPINEGQSADGTVSDQNFTFAAIPGHSYTINGWVRGENVNPDSNCRFNIEFYSYAGRDQLAVWDRDHLQRELKRLANYGQFHDLPMMLVDFGVKRDSLKNGGSILAQDMFDLLDGFSWSYAWKSYRDDSWGMYPAKGNSSPDPTLASLFQRADPVLSTVSAPKSISNIQPVLLDGFVYAQGQELIVGSSQQAIHLAGINFNNDLYTQNFPFMPHHARRDFFEVRRLGFNVIRFNLTYQWFTENPDQGWAWLDQQVAWAKEAGVYLDINMHYVPGQDVWSVSTDPESQAQTANLWRMLADRYKDETIIAAYDLMNEPFNVEPAVYQSYMQKVVSAIREVDSNHLIIVEVIPGNNPQFVTVDDDNVMYDFHHYQPGNLTNENLMGLFDTKTYPDPDYLEIRWDRLKYLGPVRTAPLPAGSSDWVLYESPFLDPGKQQNTQAFGSSGRLCKNSTGKAYFGDFQILAQKGSESPQVLVDMMIDSESIIWKKPNPGSVIFGLSPQNHNNTSDGRSLTVRESGDSGWNETIKGTFEVQPYTKYQIKGWMKGDDISSGANCSYMIDFFQLDPQDELIRHDRDFLAERMLAGIQFGEQNNVPINVGEFGVFQTTFLSPEAGGARWVTDMLDLLNENKLNFAYWDYHSLYGLYPDPFHYPDPADINRPLLDVFLARNKK